MKKAFVFFIKDKGEVEVEKGKFISPLLIKTRHHIVVITTKPNFYKGRECYFVFNYEPHSYHPESGKIIDKEVFEQARKLAEKKRLELVATSELKKPEALDPHLATERIISWVIREETFVNFLKSFTALERADLINRIVFFIIGILVGIMLGGAVMGNAGA